MLELTDLLIVIVLVATMFIGSVGGWVVSQDAYGGRRKRFYAQKEFLLRIAFSTVLFFLGFLALIGLIYLATPIEPERPFQGAAVASVMAIASIIMMSFRRER
ncbi:MAG TPA: hypothetical protein DCX32_01780 [Candidatus Moranbacteria bacterium]|nr:MAG: hypothetical protein UW87_C0009G0038 [Candidatus Moranbacteria bacterium GW2011_GWC2_45_10]KKT95118.1 MAG: hypothetical protein UW95_C0004G0036 [Parcubacteria group bacterium GW2011_GWC1_45_14]HAV11252.1 hypothetical protein [Candidatus Moranbacteria bacterium]